MGGRGFRIAILPARILMRVKIGGTLSWSARIRVAASCPFAQALGERVQRWQIVTLSFVYCGALSIMNCSLGEITWTG